jgi:hypothetical protein
VSIEAPVPVLFNSWKHHAGFLKNRIQETISLGKDSLPDLAKSLIVIGAELMDLYYGPLTPQEIGIAVIDQLKSEVRFEIEPFREWVSSSGHYVVYTLNQDHSRWVLRLGEEDHRYLHVHPGRWVPQTCRVRANVLKTAIMMLAHTGIHGGDPFNLGLVNYVRGTYLNLSPIGKKLNGDEGIGSIIDLLHSTKNG